jgi:hypothetical protein
MVDLDLSKASISELSALHAFFIRLEHLTAEFAGQPRGSKGVARDVLEEHANAACGGADRIAVEAARRTATSDFEAETIKTILVAHAIFTGNYGNVACSGLAVTAVRALAS